MQKPNGLTFFFDLRGDSRKIRVYNSGFAAIPATKTYSKLKLLLAYVFSLQFAPEP